MNSNETYGVELDLLTESYNRKIKEVLNTTKTQAKLIEQNAKVNFGNSFSLTTRKDFALDMQLEEIEDYQMQVKKILSDFKIGKIDTTQAKNALNELLNEIEITNKEFASYTNTRIKINVDDTELSLLQQAGVSTQLIDKYVQVTKQDVDNTTNSTDKLENSLGRASNEAKKLSQNTNNTNRGANELGQAFENSMNKGANSTKRLLFSLFNVHSIWSLISRASNTAITQNDAINSQVNVLNSALGNIMLPIVQKIVGYVEYGVIFAAKVIQFFTGFNALAGLTTSNLKNSVKQAKELTKTLAGFDEITNIGGSSKGSLAGGIKNDLKALDDFYKKIEEVENWMNKSGIYGFLEKVKTGLDTIWKAVQPIWDYALKPMFDFCVAHPEVLTVVFSIFLSNKLKNGIANVLGGTGSMTGLLGIKGILGNFLTMGGIGIILYIAGNIINDLEELKGQLDNIRQGGINTRDEWLKSEEDITDILNTMRVNNQAVETGLGHSHVWLTQIFGLDKELLKNAKIRVEISEKDLENLKQRYENGELTKDQQIDVLGILIDQYNTNAKIIEELETQGYDVSNLKEINGKYADLTNDINENLKEQGVEYDEIYKKIGKSKTEIENVANNKYIANIDVNAITIPAGTAINNIVSGNYETSIDVKANTSSAKNSFKSLFKSFAAAPAALLDDLGFSGLKNWVNSFDVGTNYVPNDQLAMIHKGEMIVPAKYNPMTSNIGGGHDEEIIEAIYELRDTLENKDMNAYISEDDIGRASSNYRNRRSRQLGKDVG